MKHVIDTSVGFKWAVSEIDSDNAIRLQEAHTFRAFHRAFSSAS
jgi:hypothetical protein